MGLKAFYKVWRQGDDDIDEALVEPEVSLLRHAFERGVAVPSILKYRRLHVAKGLFLIPQMSDVGDCHFVDAHEDLLVYAKSLVENVMKLHSNANSLHCDLKPQNVRVDSTNAILLDFGHAQRIGQVSPVPCTEGFEAPEVVQGLVKSYSTDAFSVGKLLLAAWQVHRKDAVLQAVSQGLCAPDKQHRMSLQHAFNMLEEHQKGQKRREAKKAKTSVTEIANCGRPSLGVHSIYA